MKKFCLLIIAFMLLIAACTPITSQSTPSQNTPINTVAPTITAAVEAPSYTPEPTYSTLPETDVPYPTDPVYQSENSGFKYEMTDAVAKFRNTMKMVGVNVNDQDVLDAMSNPSYYENKIAPDDKPYVQFRYTINVDGRDFSFLMVYGTHKYTDYSDPKNAVVKEGVYWSTLPNDIEDLKGIKFFSRINSDDGIDSSIVLSTANAIRLNLYEDFENDSGPKLFNYISFDWLKITEDWDNVENQLKQGVIPYENDALNQTFWYTRNQSAMKQYQAAMENGFTLAGDQVFYPSILYQKGIKELTPEQQAKIIKYIGAVKLIKFKGMSQIDVAGEVVGFRIWQSNKFEGPFQRLGGYAFLADLAKFMHEIDPNVLLGINEYSVTLNVQGDSTFKRHHDMIIEMLEYFKKPDVGGPISLFQDQGEAYIGSPPTEDSVKTPLQEIMNLGYQIEGPDAIVAIGSKDPIWTQWTQTVPVPQDKRGQLLLQSDIYRTRFKALLELGVRNLGVHSLSPQEDWLKSDSNLYGWEAPHPALWAFLDLIANY